MPLKLSSAKYWAFCSSRNMLNTHLCYSSPYTKWTFFVGKHWRSWIFKTAWQYYCIQLLGVNRILYANILSPWQWSIVHIDGLAQDCSNSCVQDCSISSVPPMESLQSWLWPACISQISAWWGDINTLRPRQDGRLFADDTFKRIFLNENFGILIKISLKFVPKGLINNIPALVPIMAWRRPGDKPLSEPMTVRSLVHLYESLGLNELNIKLWVVLYKNRIITL